MTRSMKICNFVDGRAKKGSVKTVSRAEDESLQPWSNACSALKLEWQELCKQFLPFQSKDSIWCYSRLPDKADPNQGWKIHISATLLIAANTLRIVAPFLQSLDLAYKAPVTLDQLRKINSGIWYGYSQVGKFITVYSRDATKLENICKKLHLLTRSIGKGPKVPFDLKFSAEGNIYYRYGSFRDHLKDGKLVSVIVSPSGEQFVDKRHVKASVPSWSANPFQQTHEPRPVLPCRYIVFRTVSQRGKGGVYEALDMADGARQCIIKEGRLNGETHWDGRDGLCRIRNEGDILKSLAKSKCNVPAIYDRFERNGNVYLVMEKIRGISLENLLMHHRGALRSATLIYICQELCKLLAKIHRQGFIWRDCTPANLLIERSGRLFAIDFEGATNTEVFDPLTWSTPLFAPPEVAHGCYRTKQKSNLPEDLFALGCCLFLILEGRLPFINQDHSRTVEFTKKIPGKIERIIRQLISADPTERPAAAAVHKILTDHESPML